MHAILSVKAQDLIQWAGTKDAQAHLPELVRRLVFATCAPLRNHFRAGEGTVVPGYDGQVEVACGNTFVPDGLSVWECGVDEDRKGKAESDYLKRTGDPLGMDPAKAAFVFVTARRWGDGDAWAEDKRKQGAWRDVRVIDADALESWLSLAAAAEIWISRRLGKRLPSTATLEEVFDEYASACDPQMSPALVLAGREESGQAIRNALANPPSILGVRADTAEEALAVIGASIHLEPQPNDRERWLARSVVVDDMDSLRALAAGRGAIIVPRCGDLSPAAGIRESHVLIPVGRDTPLAGGVQVVPRAKGRDLTKALIAAGMKEERAQNLASAVHGSIPVLRRRLAKSPIVSTPAWANPVNARVLASLLLVGAFREDTDGDREVVEAVTQRQFREVAGDLYRWSNEPDAPIEQILGVWRWVSREDAWALLAPHLSADEVLRTTGTIAKVLRAVDPKFELPPEERYMAPVVGKVPRVSPALRESLADTLGFLATRLQGLAPDLQARNKGAAVACVRATLADPLDWQHWATLDRCLPDVAEAAPEAFLNALESALRDRPETLRRLLADQPGGLMGGDCLHAGLLWALECLAWSPTYLPRASLALARLADLDPGVKGGNRPSRSLREIFLGWHPQTCAPLDLRLQVLDQLLRRAPHATFNLLVSLLPQFAGDSASPTYRPRWREWADAWTGEMTNIEYLKCIRAVAGKLMDALGTALERWTAVLPHLEQLPEPDQVVARFCGVDWSQLSEADAGRLAATLRSILHRHREFQGEAGWALPETTLAPLAATYELLLGSLAPLTRYAWLFSQRPDLPSPPPARDYDEFYKRCNDERAKAVAEIIESDGVEALLTLARRAEFPHFVGVAAAQTGGGAAFESASFSNATPEDERAVELLLRGYAGERARVDGAKWLSTIKAAHENGEMTEARAGLLLTGLPFTGPTWVEVEGQPEGVRRAYWAKVYANYLQNPGQDLKRAVELLLAHDRLDAAFELAGTNLVRDRRDHRLKLPPELLLAVLEKLVTSTDWRPTSMSSYYLGEVFKHLQDDPDADRTRVAQMEWAYLPMFEHREAAPRVLFEELSSSPAFFVQVLCMVFKGRKEPRAEAVITDRDRLQAEHGYRLLRTWRLIPGSEGGEIDAKKLRTWVAEARALAAEKDRAEIADQTIGGLFAHSPTGKDGIWPHEAVREAIEEAESEHLELGMQIGIANSRGVFSKSIGEGGRQERELAARYDGLADQLAAFPRTCAVLRAVAESYRHDAQREDARAKLDDDL